MWPKCAKFHNSHNLGYVTFLQGPLHFKRLLLIDNNELLALDIAIDVYKYCVYLLYHYSTEMTLHVTIKHNIYLCYGTLTCVLLNQQ